MSSSVNYDDLYEEFVRLTSSPSKSPRQGGPSSLSMVLETVRIKQEREDSPPESPLRALTPPSPLTPRISGKELRMCDTSAPVTSQNSGGGGKQIMSGGENSTSVGGVHQTFISGGVLPAQLVQQQQQNSQTQQQLQRHNLVMEGHHHHSATQQQHLHHHPSIHPQQGGYNGHLQHHLMDSHHHHHSQQQLSLGQQHGAHHLGHPQGHPPTTHQHHHIAHSQQQLMPFGIHLNASGGSTGNGSSFVSHPQLNPFHSHHHQIPNQQPAHAMTPLQQHACFMQHATCMQLQQQQQSLAALSTQRAGVVGAGGVVGWMGNAAASPISMVNSNGGGGGSSGNSCGNSSGGSNNMVAKVATPSLQSPVIPDPNALPGGLEVLWREVPTEYQRLMMPQDVPDTARFRGYFTVCELLALKRLLEARYLGCKDTPVGVPILAATAKGKEDGEKGSKRKRGSGNNSSSGSSLTVIPLVSSENGFRNGTDAGNSKRNKAGDNENERSNCDGKEDKESSMEQDGEADEDSSGGELMINLDNIKHEIHTEVTPAVVTGVCVGGAVKEALEALSSSSDQNTGSNTDGTSEGIDKENNYENHESGDNPTGMVDVGQNVGEQEIICNSNQEGVMQEAIPITVALPSIECTSQSDFVPDNQSSINSPKDQPQTVSEIPTNGENLCCEGQQNQESLMLTSTIGDPTGQHNMMSTSTVRINTSVAPPTGNCCVPVESRYAGQAPPPYRTATLVLKLLQIGQYHIRSFSSLNPNRLRVLFNTQRMTYECQLPIVRPTTNSPGALRKVLTVDIGFEQVSMIRFGQDTLFMRIEGAPLLTVSYNPAQEETTTQLLTPHDQFLLEQIDKGQLKLSPCHQLYFLNERLVQLLESQFREHPKFRHLLMDQI